jgi:uncharacterized protein (TIGR01244 family)
MPVTITLVTEDFSVAPQLSPSDIAEIASRGFRSIINNRPDGEGGPGQPSNDALCAAAEALGLVYAFLPVSPTSFPPEAVDSMRDLLMELPRPILAFCRSGNRAAKLYKASV